MEEARAENESLKEKINGLKQQYGPIGKQVYNNNHSEIRLGGGDKPLELFCPHH